LRLKYIDFMLQVVFNFKKSIKSTLIKGKKVFNKPILFGI